jgi:hypothetical protein
MSNIEEILHSNIKPKEKQLKLTQAVISSEIPAEDFISFFETAKDVDKGSCADAMKHISAKRPELLAPYINTLIGYINHRLPRVKWGVPEAIGNMAKDYPQEAAKAIPNILKNTTDEKNNTTVIKWCAAFALGEIAKYNPTSRAQLLPIFDDLIKSEKNTGVKNVYLKAIKSINKRT